MYKAAAAGDIHLHITIGGKNPVPGRSNSIRQQDLWGNNSHVAFGRCGIFSPDTYAEMPKDIFDSI